LSVAKGFVHPNHPWDNVPTILCRHDHRYTDARVRAGVPVAPVLRGSDQ